MTTPRLSTRGSRYAPARAAASRAPRMTGDAASRVRRVTVAVNGLYYENSLIGLAHQLHKCPGILDVAVDPRAGTALITFDESRLSEDAVIRLISDCGYELGRRDVAHAEAGAMRAVGDTTRAD